MRRLVRFVLVAALAVGKATRTDFFIRLAKYGITPQNALFNFSSDENDHFADKTYTRLEAELRDFGLDRDSLAAQMRSLLNGAAFNGKQITQGKAKHLIERAEDLLAEVHAAAA